MRDQLGSDLRLSPTGFTLESFTQVLEGDADFTLVDGTAVRGVQSKYSEMRKGLKVAFEFPSREAFGIAVRPGSDLLPLLDAYLRRIEESGELQALWRKYELAD